MTRNVRHTVKPSELQYIIRLRNAKGLSPRTASVVVLDGCKALKHGCAMSWGLVFLIFTDCDPLQLFTARDFGPSASSFAIYI